MADIKLFVCCHQMADVPPHSMLLPTQVGADLAEERFPGFLQDNVGENISGKNRSYCELTAQYWAWKNVEAEYYGFFHYRRYLYPNKMAKRPYLIEGNVSLALLNKLGYLRFDELIRQYDLIVPMGENMYVSVREHYAKAPEHNAADLKLAEQIVLSHYPEMAEDLHTYLSGTYNYFGNIFIMKKAVFFSYCQWLFPVLEEFDRKADLAGYSPQALRVDGYLAERLLGIYYTASRRKFKTLELPRVHFDEAKDIKKRIAYRLFPPGTRRRAVTKRCMKGFDAGHEAG